MVIMIIVNTCMNTNHCRCYHYQQLLATKKMAAVHEYNNKQNENTCNSLWNLASTKDFADWIPAATIAKTRSRQ
jgi:hypothetical protein